MPETSADDSALAMSHPLLMPTARMFPNRRRGGARPAPHGIERRAGARAATPPAEPAVPPLFRTRAVTLGLELAVCAVVWLALLKLAHAVL